MRDLSPWDAGRARQSLDWYLLRHGPEERRWTKWTHSNLIFIFRHQVTWSWLLQICNINVTWISCDQTPSGKKWRLVENTEKRHEKTTNDDVEGWHDAISKIYTSKGPENEFRAKARRASIIMVDKITSVWNKPNRENWIEKWWKIENWLGMENCLRTSTLHQCISPSTSLRRATSFLTVVGVLTSFPIARFIAPIGMIEWSARFVHQQYQLVVNWEWLPM